MVESENPEVTACHGHSKTIALSVPLTLKTTLRPAAQVLQDSLQRPEDGGEANQRGGQRSKPSATDLPREGVISTEKRNNPQP